MTVMPRRRKPLPIEPNVARDFLYPGAASASTRQRAWLAAVELHGSEREAERRGHRRPEST